MTADEGHAATPQCVWRVYHVPILLGIVSLVCTLLSITIFIKSYQDSVPIRFSSDAPNASPSGAIASGTILVDIEGGVRVPGVYRLPIGSRTDDALSAAGGLSGDADLIVVSRSINRAAKLIDGAKLYIPVVGETSGSSVGSRETSDMSSNARININTAEQFELEGLPGVGPATAGKIIRGRPYVSIDELVTKKAIGDALFQRLKSQLTL